MEGKGEGEGEGEASEVTLARTSLRLYLVAIFRRDSKEECPFSYTGLNRNFFIFLFFLFLFFIFYFLFFIIIIYFFQMKVKG